MKRLGLAIVLWLCWSCAALAQQFITPTTMRDADLTLTNTQNLVTTLNTFTAQRTITIPGRGAMNAYYLQIVDAARAINGSNSLRIVAADGALINGSASVAVTSTGAYIFIIASPDGYVANIAYLCTN